MNNKDNQLDAMLHHWAEQATSANQLANLNDRIVSSLTKPIIHTSLSAAQHDLRAPSMTVVPDRLKTSDSRRNNFGAGMALGTMIAAVLLLGVVISDSKHQQVTHSESPPACAWLQHEQLANQSVLLKEMEDLFDQRLAWLAETDEEMNFGLAESPNAPDSSQRVAVRIVVQQKPPGQSQWQLAWAVNVVSRDEEMVTVVPAEANGNELQLWTYRLPDGAIAVDGEVILAGKNEVRTNMLSMHRDNKPREVAIVRDHAAEYRVFQAVAVLDGGVI